MPRLDNSNELVANTYGIDGKREEPVDLCEYCIIGWRTELWIEHPNYGGNFYHCEECESLLSERDNTSSVLEESSA